MLLVPAPTPHSHGFCPTHSTHNYPRTRLKLVVCEIKIVDGDCCRTHALVLERSHKLLAQGRFPTALGRRDADNEGRARRRRSHAMRLQLLGDPFVHGQVVRSDSFSAANA